MIWHSAELGELINELGTDEKLGLSSDEAQRRLAKYGKNQLNQKRKGLFLNGLLTSSKII